MTDPAADSSDRWAPLRLPNYRRFLLAFVATTLAIQIQASVVSFQMYALTRDPLSLGLVGLAEALPFMLLALAGGHAADRHSRKRLATLGILGQLTCTLGLLAVTVAGAWLDTLAVKSALLLLVAATGVARAFLQPARNALGADIVPEQLQARSVTIRTLFFQISMVLGPALGGGLYAWVGPRGGYVASSVLLGLGVAAFVMVKPPQTQHEIDRPPSFMVGLRQSLAFLRGDRVLLPAIALDMFAVLFGGATALLPAFAEEILHVGPRGFGLLRASPAIGAITLSLVLTLRGRSFRAGPALLVAVAVFGASMIGFALSRVLWLSVALLAVSGAADMVSVVIRSTLMQTRVPPHMRGRMSSINQIFIGSSNEIGAFESGVAARVLGLVPSVLFGGTMTLVVVGVLTIRAPALRKLGPL